MHGRTQEMENQLTSKQREGYVVPPTQENCWGEGCVHVVCEFDRCHRVRQSELAI